MHKKIKTEYRCPIHEYEKLVLGQHSGLCQKCQLWYNLSYLKPYKQKQ